MRNAGCGILIAVAECARSMLDDAIDHRLITNILVLVVLSQSLVFDVAAFVLLLPELLFS